MGGWERERTDGDDDEEDQEGVGDGDEGRREGEDNLMGVIQSRCERRSESVSGPEGSWAKGTEQRDG